MDGEGEEGEKGSGGSFQACFPGVKILCGITYELSHFPLRWNILKRVDNQESVGLSNVPFNLDSLG